jgi:hypothetical protein
VGYLVQPNPRRVAHDEIESASRADIGEMRCEREWERGAILQRALALPYASDLGANVTQPLTCISRRMMPSAEQILRARCDKQFFANAREANALVVEDVQRR